MKTEKPLSLKTLTKSTAWDVQENDIFRMWKEAEKELDLKEDHNHYFGIIRAAFDVEPITVDRPEVIAKYEERGYLVGQLRTSERDEKKWAVKKRPISRITDLTYENIRHISAAKLLEVIDRNFGGGWESLSQSIQDIILSGFDISTTTLPQNRLHNPGGMYEKKVQDDFEVLEIQKGTWVEAIFAKAKPLPVKPTPEPEPIDKRRKQFKAVVEDDEEEEEEILEIEDEYDDEEEDTFDEEELAAESYRTTYDEDPDDLTIDDVADTEEEY